MAKPGRPGPRRPGSARPKSRLLLWLVLLVVSLVVIFFSAPAKTRTVRRVVPRPMQPTSRPVPSGPSFEEVVSVFVQSHGDAMVQLAELGRDTGVRGLWQSLGAELRQNALLEARGRLVSDKLASLLKEGSEEERATMIATVVEEVRTLDESTTPFDFTGVLSKLEAGTENAGLPPAPKTRRGASPQETAATQNAQMLHALRSALLSRFMLLVIEAAKLQAKDFA